MIKQEFYPFGVAAMRYRILQNGRFGLQCGNSVVIDTRLPPY